MKPDPGELLRELEIEEELVRRLRGDVLGFFTPNPTQWEFLSSKAHETLLSGPNQYGGKTWVLRAKATYHITGRYPEHWEGVRFDKPPRCAIAGVTAQTTRDHLIDPLFGDSTERGTGWIPEDCFNSDVDLVPLGGKPTGMLDYAKVRHVGPDGEFNGYSRVHFFSYDRGWRRVQGYPLDWIGLDEMPQDPVYNELRARINKTMGYIDIAACPMEGETETYLMFEEDTTGLLRLIPYTIDDCLHLTKEEYDFAYKRWANHPEAEARLFGRPCRATGMVYGFRPDSYVVRDFTVPSSWPCILGLDFPHGVGRFACVKLAINPEDDVVYVTGEYKAEGLETSAYAGRVAAMGGRHLPVAWPHDGGRTYQGASGGTIAAKYRDHGLNLLRRPAFMKDIQGKNTNSLMAVIDLVIDRLATGRFKVFESCSQIRREMRLYRHEKGKVKPNQDDDLIDAMHKAMMSLRYADTSKGRARDPVIVHLGDYEFYS